MLERVALLNDARQADARAAQRLRQIHRRGGDGEPWRSNPEKISDDRIGNLVIAPAADPVNELIRDELAPMPVPLPASVSNFHRMMLPEHPYLADYNPLLMWDLSFASQAWRELQ